MKVQLSFKTTDVEDQLEADEMAAAGDLISEYVEYGEYLHVEFDTEKKTCIALKK